MNRREFSDILRNSLEGQMTKREIQDQLRYYDQYIQSEMDKGRSWQEIEEELGDPRLLARTLLSGDRSSADSAPYPDTDGMPDAYPSSGGQNRRFVFHYSFGEEPDWKTKAKWIVGLVCVLLIVLFIFAALVGFVIWLLPVILIVVGISWILRRLNGR